MYKIITTIATADVKPVGGGNTLWDDVTNILEAIILVLGLAAVAFIIYGGVQYISSSGDPGKVEKAKKPFSTLALV